MPNFVFKNRVSDHSNRRKLTIVQQQGNEMLVDIERADTNVTEEGTPITATVLNQWNSAINEAESKSTDALSKATIAETNSASASESAASALKQVNALVKEVDVSQIKGTGSPDVSFISNSDGTKKLSFKNLKGEKGASGTILSVDGVEKQRLNLSLRGDELTITVE